MKKLFISFFALMFTMLTYAQIPSSMMYQVMVTTGSTTPQDVKIGMALYTTADGTTPVWSNDYSFTNVADKTVENLELDFSTVNLSSGAFWLATSINDTEVGRVMLTPVPFAIVTKTLESVITKAELVGTWENTYQEQNRRTITFNADGTGKVIKYSKSPSSSDTTTTFTYIMDNTGCVALIYEDSKRDDCECVKLIKIANKKYFFGGINNVFDSDIFNKQ